MNTEPWTISPEKQEDGQNSQTKAIEMLEIAYRDGKHEFDWIHLSVDKKTIDYHVSLTRIEINDEIFLHTIWRDISDKKKAEEELKNQIMEKNRYFSILAHDLSSMIGGNVSVIDFITNSSALPIEQIDSMNSIIYKNSIAAYKLLQDLITWGRAVQGKILLEPELIIPNESISRVLEILNVKAEEKNIAIKVDCSKKIQLNIDPNMMNTILRNIFTNAIKYSYADSVINTKVWQYENKINIEIADYGVGMTQEKADRMFVFEQIESTPGTEGETGHGLGLQIVKEYVTMNSGTIKAISALGEGTTIIISFPVKSEKTI